MPGAWTPERIRTAEQQLFERVPEPVVMRRATLSTGAVDVPAAAPGSGLALEASAADISGAGPSAIGPESP